MWKKKLWTPLSTTLRRGLPPTSCRLSTDTIFEAHFSPACRSLTSVIGEEEPRGFPSRRNQFLGNFRIPGKHFSSESSEKILPRCWNCNAFAGSTTPFLVCGSCRCIQPIDHSIDYFQIFGLKKKYEIGDQNLEGKYKDWQKKIHPDLVHSKSEKEREYAAEQSARVIDAYRTLTNPLSRAIYILNLEGVHVDEEKTVSEPELLAEILEVREAVEEAENSQALNQIQDQMQEKFKHWSKSFANAFEGRKYEEALTSIHRMTYYKRVNEEIVKKL